MPNVTQIAGGLLTPGEKASAQLRRLARSFDSASKMNILQLFVACGIGPGDTKEFLEKLRMLRHVYGLSVLTLTQDGLTGRSSLQNNVRLFQIICVRQSLWQGRRSYSNSVVVRCPQPEGLQFKVANRRLPSLAIKMIGKLSGLPSGRAESINEGIAS